MSTRLIELAHYTTAWAAPHQRYQELLDNETPPDTYLGRQDQILAEQQQIKQLTMFQ